MKIQTKHPDAFTSLAYVFGVDDHVFLDLNYTDHNVPITQNHFGLYTHMTYSNHKQIITVCGLLILGTRYFRYKDNKILREVFLKDLDEHAVKFLNTIKLGVYELNSCYSPSYSIYNYYIPKYKPVTRFLNLADFISLEDAYASVYNYLLEQNLSKECTVEISNLDKLQQHGFDKKISFRHRK